MYKVLLVEDEAQIRAGLKKLIEDIIGGFEVIGEFNDGRQALEQGSRLQPDVLITDIRMKEMSGIELIEKIRLDLPDVPIVIISGYSDFIFMKKALLHKVYDYLLKPIDRVELTKCLTRIKAELDQRPPIGEAQSPGREESASGDSLTIRRIKQLIAEQLEHNISLRSIAEQVYLSPKYVSELFKRETNENFVDYIIRCRLERAKTLLRTSQLKIYEIASLVGYSNTKHFMTLFRQETGMTPSEYRNG
jgi:YesN/AraC family two-component response regulator